MAGLLWRSLNHRCYDLQRRHAGTFNQSHDSVSGPPLPAAPVSVSREAEPTLDSQRLQSHTGWGGRFSTDGFTAGTEVKEEE